MSPRRGATVSPPELDPQVADEVLELARVAAHSKERRFAPLACFMAGVQNVVAPQGTAFTTDHARVLKRYVEEVVLCFDSDEAGQNAAVRSLDSDRFPQLGQMKCGMRAFRLGARI